MVSRLIPTGSVNPGVVRAMFGRTRKWAQARPYRGRFLDSEPGAQAAWQMFTDKRHIPLRSASVRTPHLFHHGIPKVPVNPQSKGITSVRSTFTL
jgi:hypothetical protein